MTAPNTYAAEIAAAQARLAAAQAEVADLRAKLAAEHEASKNAQQNDDEITGRAVTAADGKAAAARRFATKADDAGTDAAQDSAAAGKAAARARFGARS